MISYDVGLHTPYETGNGIPLYRISSAGVQSNSDIFTRIRCNIIKTNVTCLSSIHTYNEGKISFKVINYFRKWRKHAY